MLINMTVCIYMILDEHFLVYCRMDGDSNENLLNGGAAAEE